MNYGVQWAQNNFVIGNSSWLENLLVDCCGRTTFLPDQAEWPPALCPIANIADGFEEVRPSHRTDFARDDVSRRDGEN